MPRPVNPSRSFHSPYEEQPLVRPVAVYTRHLIRPLSKKHPGWDIAKRVAMAIFAAPVYVLLGIPALFGLPFVKKNQPPRPLAGASTGQPNPVVQQHQPVSRSEIAKDAEAPSAPIPRQVTTTPVGNAQNTTQSVRQVLFSPQIESIPTTAPAEVVPGDRKSVNLGKARNEKEEELEELSSSDEGSDIEGSDSDTASETDSVSSSSSSSDDASATQPLLSSQNRRLNPLDRSHATPLRAAQKVEAPKKGKGKSKKLLDRPFKLEVRPRGELITAKMKDANGNTFCHETAERAHTVQHLRKSIDQKKAQIDVFLKNGSISPAKAKEIAFLREDISNTEMRLNQLLINSPDATWASTDAPRAHFRLIKEELTKEGYSKSEARKRALIIGKQQSLPILGNLRHQEVKFVAPQGLKGYGDTKLAQYLSKKSQEGAIYDSVVLERYNLYLELKAGKSLPDLQKDPSYKEQLNLLAKEAGFKKEAGGYTAQAMINFMERISIPYYVSNDRGVNRSAAVTDFMHGETSHEDLTIYLLLEKLVADSNEWRSLSTIERLRIKTYFPGIMDNRDNFHPKVAKKTLERLKKTFVKAYPEFDIKRLSGGNLTNKISEIARRREEHLFEKAMQDLALHLETHPLEANANSLFYGRIGFVDPSKKVSNDDDGFCLNERSQALDSAAIYRMLDGKTLVFDGDDNSVPMRDLNDPNIIHLPKKFRKGGPNSSKSVTLQTSYLNLSVAGNLKNKGDQAAINFEGLKRLENAIAGAGLNEKEYERAVELFGKLQIGLQEGKEGGDFAVVDNALELMTLLGYASCNCYGGKDRTGYGVAVHDHSKMKKYLQQVHPDDPNYQEKAAIYASLGREMISYKGVIISVIRDNVAISAMKLARTDLDLLLDGDGLEFAMGAGRLFANTLQFVEGFLPETIQQAGQAVAGVKKGEGNLYA